MKQTPNPLAGLVDAMQAHDKRLARKEPPARTEPASSVPTVQIQTVATMSAAPSVGEKVFCAARYTRGQIEKVDRIILLTHKERGVRLTQSDVLKQAVERMPAAALEQGEVAEILTANGRKQLTRRTV
jgi:hypothetical protein